MVSRVKTSSLTKLYVTFDPFWLNPQSTIQVLYWRMSYIHSWEVEIAYFSTPWSQALRLSSYQDTVWDTYCKRQTLGWEGLDMRLTVEQIYWAPNFVLLLAFLCQSWARLQEYCDCNLVPNWVDLFGHTFDSAHIVNACALFPTPTTPTPTVAQDLEVQFQHSTCTSKAHNNVPLKALQFCMHLLRPPTLADHNFACSFTFCSR